MERREAKPKIERRPTKTEIAEAEAKRNFGLKVRLIDRSFNLLKTMVILGSLMGLTYLGIVRPLELTAGKRTIVDVVYMVGLNLKLHMIVPWAAAALFGGLWHRERKLRKRAVANLWERMKEKETRIDPHRTSSGLTPMGEAPEDKP